MNFSFRLARFLAVSLLSIVFVADVSAQDLLSKYRDAAVEKWEAKIAALELKDQQQTDPSGGILFIGSSSIRLWESIQTDMAPYLPIQRGYGGAKYSDLAVFAQRLIQPHEYRALVVFVANDVRGKPDDKTPDEVEKLVRYVIKVSQDHQPEAPVLIIEVTPTESRYAAWKEIRAVNARLREIALTTADCYFVPTAGQYLRRDGSPRSELFVKDKLHLNREGYRLWGKLIRQRLDEVFRLMAEDETETEAGTELIR